MVKLHTQPRRLGYVRVSICGQTLTPGLTRRAEMGTQFNTRMRAALDLTDASCGGW
jgi:hypothetical protein